MLSPGATGSASALTAPPPATVSLGFKTTVSPAGSHKAATAGRDPHLAAGLAPHRVPLAAASASSSVNKFDVQVRIDTPVEPNYYRIGGILQTVLRKLLRG